MSLLILNSNGHDSLPRRPNSLLLFLNLWPLASIVLQACRDGRLVNHPDGSTRLALGRQCPGNENVGRNATWRKNLRAVRRKPDPGRPNTPPAADVKSKPTPRSRGRDRICRQAAGSNPSNRRGGRRRRKDRGNRRRHPCLPSRRCNPPTKPGRLLPNPRRPRHPRRQRSEDRNRQQHQARQASGC